MGLPKSKQALEQLREQVRVAYTRARENPLWNDSLENLAQLVDSHKLGDYHSGWTNPYPKADPRSMLLEYQFAYSHDRARFKVGCQSRQSGKDFSSEGEIVDDCMSRKTEWMVAAPSERQALDSLDQGKLWARGFDLAIEDYQEVRVGGSETLLKSAEITFANGSRVRAVPGKPDTVRGRSANVLLTEFDFFENPRETWRAILPSITNPLRGGEKKVRMVSTPNGIGSPMHDIMRKPDGKKMKWSRHLVTIYHAVLMGLPVDVAEVKEAMDDADGFAQEYLCQFIDLASTLLTYELIASCEDERATVELNKAALQSREHPAYLGVDIGRKHDLTVLWILQQMGDVLWTRGVIEMEKTRFRVQEQEIADLLKSFPSIKKACIDSTGIGANLAENLATDFGTFRVEECPFTAPFKQEIYVPLRSCFEDRGVRVPVSRVIREDLHGIQKMTSSSGNIRFVAPHNDDGHCDRATALALAKHASTNETDFFVANC